MKLLYVNKFKDRHGKVRTYYRRSGKRQAIDGEIGSAEWMSSYLRIHRSFEAAATAVPDHETLAFAIQGYIASYRFKKLAFNTQKNYRSVIDELTTKLGNQPLSEFTRGSVITIRDKIAERSMSRAKMAINVMRAVFEHAADHDWIDRNPAKGVLEPPGFKSTPYRKWTDDEIALFKNEALPHVRRAMMVLLHSGLRCSDALSLRRNVVRGDAIDMTTQKTGANVVIPIHHDLRDELKKPLPVASVYLISGVRGQKLGRHGLLAMFRREFDRLGVDRADQPTTDGLRKNAVVALIEAGANEQIIHSITGQSFATIRHYGQEYQRRKVAMKVVDLWNS